MARKPRISYPGALHHIIVRGNHKERIFLCDADRIKFIKVLTNYKELYLFQIFAYVLMPNHVHLLVEEAEIPLPKIMQSLNQSYTQYFNLKYDQMGHLFHGRYKSILCDKDRYLLVLVRYIHLNPVHAKLVQYPEDYKWSSHNDYICGGDRSFIDMNFVLSLFSSKKKQAIKRYKSFIHNGMEEGIESTLEIGTFLGDEEFTENINSKYVKRQSQAETKLPLSNIINLVTNHFNISEQQLRTKCREKKFCKIRGLIGYLAREFTCADNRMIAQYFNRTASTMSHAIQKTIRLAQEDPTFKRLMDQLIIKIRKSAK